VLTLPLSSKGLGVERNQRLPDVPEENVHWVCDAEGVARCYEAGAYTRSLFSST
jgi:hypothetical protein